MLCTFCNTARLANEAPCPQCGAPSPLIGASLPPAPTWGGPSPFQPNTRGNNQEQHAWPQAPQEAHVPQFPTHIEQQQTSLLPVPFQQQSMSMAPSSVTAGNTRMPAPLQNIGALLPAQPEQEGTIYVPPMYTKPRAIIPPYRAISGLVSVLIVAILFCAGTSYYVKASGQLTALSQLSGIAPPANLKPAPTAPLPDPQKNQETGLGYSIINSATTTAKINGQGVAIEQDTVFKPGQTIYLTYSVQHPQTPGTIVVKWYTNNSLYQVSNSKLITEAVNGTASQQYVQPAEGKVELYWNNQLAIRLYFVVR